MSKASGSNVSYTLLSNNRIANQLIDGKTYKYGIHFSILYKADVGERLSVIGSIKELGEWKDY